MSRKLSNQSVTFIEAHHIKRVLVIKLTSLGDVIHALPVAASLKKAFPFLKLHWIVEDRCAPLLENHPLLDSIIVYPRKEIQSLITRGRWGQALKQLNRIRRSLRTLKIDLSLDLQGLAKSGLMALMAGAPQRIGCFGLKEFSQWISKGLPEGGDLHAVDRNLKVAEFIGAGKGTPEFVIGIPEDEKRWAKTFLEQRRVAGKEDLLGVQIGASLPQKRWPVHKVISFIQKVSRLQNIRVLLLGDQTDRDSLQPHLSRIPEEVINTTGDLSLRRLSALISHCRLFVGADTGPLHLAVGLGIPVVALYGADDPQKTGPYGLTNRLHYKNFPCSPCYKIPSCQGRYDCMEAISVEEVMESVQTLLKGLRSKVEGLEKKE
jgi:heptosyltransferase I